MDLQPLKIVIDFKGEILLKNVEDSHQFSIKIVYY